MQNLKKKLMQMLHLMLKNEKQKNEKKSLENKNSDNKKKRMVEKK